MKEYSTPNTFPPINFNAMFHYGINIDPQMRKEGLGRMVCRNLFTALFEQGRISGCDYFVSDPRLHTYNGSKNNPEIETLYISKVNLLLKSFSLEYPAIKINGSSPVNSTGSMVHSPYKGR